MKIRVRTKQGEFMDDLNHFTQKWQDIEEARCRGEYLDNPNLEVEFPKAKPAAEESE